MMDKDFKEKLDKEDHVLVPERMYTTREDLEAFGFTARCPGRVSLLRGDGETSAFRKLPKAD